jgi:hypothetical protein
MIETRGFKMQSLRVEDGTEFVHVEFPNGDDVRRPATAKDREEYPAEYEAFLAGRTGPIGTPVSELGLPEGQLEVLKRKGYETIELLAGVSDDNIRALRDGYALQRKARKYLEENRIPPGVKREIDKLQAQITDLEVRLAAALDVKEQDNG